MHNVSVDLYKILRQALAIGTSGYSLKDLEHLYMEKCIGEVTTSGGSIVAYHRWIESNQSEDWNKSDILREIRDYNEVDCLSTWQLAGWLRSIQDISGIPFIPWEKASDTDQQTKRQHPNEAASILADELLSDIESRGLNGEKQRVTELLAWLLEFHRRLHSKRRFG